MDKPFIFHTRSVLTPLPLLETDRQKKSPCGTGGQVFQVLFRAIYAESNCLST